MIRRCSDSLLSRGWLSLLVLMLAACATVDTRQGALPAAPELTATPFFPQRDFQCGPAALATVLAAAGVPVTADGLAPEVYLPGRHGSLQAEMLATARRYRHIAYPVDGFADLVTQLRAGSPVVVLQRLGVWPLQVWHYAVVIGFDPVRREVVLRSGVDYRLTQHLDRFLGSWQPGGNWAFVVLAPGQVPAEPEVGRYLAAAAATEPMLSPAERMKAYRAATATWPASAGAHFALGNVLQQSGLDATAEAAWRMALTLQPGHAGAINNLAELLVARGRRDAALRLLDQGLAGRLEPEALRPVLIQTRGEVAGGQSKSAAPSKKSR